VVNINEIPIKPPCCIFPNAFPRPRLANTCCIFGPKRSPSPPCVRGNGEHQWNTVAPPSFLNLPCGHLHVHCECLSNFCAQNNASPQHVELVVVDFIEIPSRQSRHHYSVLPTTELPTADIANYLSNFRAEDNVSPQHAVLMVVILIEIPSHHNYSAFSTTKSPTADIANYLSNFRAKKGLSPHHMVLVVVTIIGIPSHHHYSLIYFPPRKFPPQLLQNPVEFISQTSSLSQESF